MKDFYSELGLNFGASPQEIAAAAATRPQCQNAANVLLNPLKKQMYDQAYLSMHEIGMLRAALETQSPYWVQEQASFVRTPKQGKSIRTCRQLRRSGRAFWILLILLLFANATILYLYHDKFPELNNLDTFSFFKDKTATESTTTDKSLLPDGVWKKEALDNIASYGGKYYKIFNSEQTKTVFSWEDAQMFCEQNFGQLAVLDSKQENDFIVDWLEKLSMKDVYFGLTDKDSEGVWVSGKGKKATYFNWAPGEPNNEFGREHYVLFYHRSPKGKWNDGVPGENFLFLCQWDSREDFSKYEQAIGSKAQKIYTGNSLPSASENPKIGAPTTEKNQSPALPTSPTGKGLNSNHAGGTPGQPTFTNRSSAQGSSQLKPSLPGTYDGAFETDNEPVSFTLRITQENGKFSAILEFYPMDPRQKNSSNSGKYRMNVKYDSLTREYIFKGEEWIERPQNGKFAHLRGKFSANSFSGTVFLDLSSPGWKFSARKNLGQ